MDSKADGISPPITENAELEPTARTMLEVLDLDDDDEIFFGPITDKEKLKSKKMRRKTEVYRPGFRAGLGKDEEGDDREEGEMAEEEVNDNSHTGEKIHFDCETIAPVSPESVSSQDIHLVEEKTNTLSPGSLLQEEEDSLKSLSKLDESYQHTPSPHQKRPGSSDPVINVSTPPVCLVRVSPQEVAAARGETDVHLCNEVKLFNAAEGITASSKDLTRTESGEDQLSMNRANAAMDLSLQTVGTIVVSSAMDLPLQTVGTIAVSSATEGICLKKAVEDVNGGYLSSNVQMNPLVVKPTPYNQTSQNTLIYSSPVMISTNTQRVQMEDPLGYGNSSALSHPNTANQTISTLFQERTSTLSTTEYSAFGKPSQSKGLLHPHNLLPVPGPLYGSPASYTQGVNNLQGDCVLQQSLMHKENVNPDRQPNQPIVASHSATKYSVLSSISSPVMSALQPPSPRVLQLSNHQTSVSPSSAKRQLIEEKRALLARLRVEKQELRQRIKDDNEKCFNMKLENAAALQSNMARGMTPLFDRLPSQGCDGPAALTLTERELEMVTKLHTLQNSQQNSSDRTQSPCSQDMRHREEGRLHWHEDLIVNAEELSSPSRPRCTARTILSKKGNSSARNGPGVIPSLSAKPRARQHLMF